MNEPSLIHYSAKPFTGPVMAMFKSEGEQSHRFKPDGLWVSVGDEWKKWSENEDWNLGSLSFQSEIILHERADILRLSSADAIAEFSDRFGKPDKLISDVCLIDWTGVASTCQGIIIAPYQWKHRLSLMWYWTWDCASGCIWNPEAVAEIKPIGGVTQ